MNVESLKGVLNLLGSAFPFQDEASKTAFHDAVNNLDSDAAPEPTPETPAPEAPAEAATPVEDGPVATPAEPPVAAVPTGPGNATAEQPGGNADTSVDDEIAKLEAQLADLQAQKAQG